MIRGIGVDAVSISEIERLKEGPDNFYAYTFSPRELQYASQRNTAQTLAGCFAAKEAVFKAVAYLMPNKTFDFRVIELLHNPDGSPYIFLNEETQELLRVVEVDRLFVSITNEEDLVIAFVVAEHNC